MPEQNFIDTGQLSGTRITADGYLVAEVLCARTGCQEYAGRDLGLTSDRVSVYRPEEVVFAKDSLATFAGKPITIGHPSEPVNSGNWKDLAVGDIGTEIARDGEFVRVPIKLMDKEAIAAVIGGVRELSMGYTTGVEIRDGVAPDGTRYQAVQTGPIRINHLAIVSAARGGTKLRIGDGADHWGVSPINQEDNDMPDIKTRMVMVDGLSVETTDAGAQAIEKLLGDARAAKAAHEAELATKDSAIIAKDKELATKDAELTATKAKLVDASALDKLVADRSDLISKAKAIAPAIVVDGKSASEIKKAAVVAKSGAAMADKSEAYIDAMFDILASDSSTDDPLKKALGDGTQPKPKDQTDVYAARDAALSNSWKAPSKKEAV